MPNESLRHGLLTEILAGNAAFVRRAAAIPAAERIVPVIVVEEILRGRLHAIRQAEAGKSKITIERAYAYHPCKGPRSLSLGE